MTIKNLKNSIRHKYLRKIAKNILWRWPFPVIAKLENGRQCYVDLRSGIGRHILFSGNFDPIVFNPFREVLTEGSIFWDIGANVGFYSLLGLDLVGEKGSVHAFEIDPRPIACLRKTIKKFKIPNLYLHELAVGEKYGRCALKQQDDSGHTQVHIDATGKQITMDTLDNISQSFLKNNVCGIKIDVEGMELMVLRGATRILREKRPVVVFEAENEHFKKYGYSQEDIFTFLRTLRYKYTWLEGAWDRTVVAKPCK